MFNLDEYTNKFISLPWLKEGIIFLAKSGSQAYGTNTPTSDLDIKGIAIPPSKYYFGFINIFEQAITDSPSDFTAFCINKFFNLASNCNPSSFEVLFTDESDYFICTKIGQKLIENRDKFLSKRAKHTFSGYAISQLNRIKTHRSWMLNPIDKPPTREEFGLPQHTLIPQDQLKAAESQIRKKIESWAIDYGTHLDEFSKIELEGKLANMFAEMSLIDRQWELAAKSLGFTTNFLELVDNEKRFNGRMRNYTQYQEWKRSRNPARAELEAKYGLDTKHASHLVRLMRMCREILETGKVLVKRPDAEELLAIRNGAWSYDQIVEWAEKEDKSLEEVYKNCTILPKEPDRNFLDNLCQELIEEHLCLTS